MHRENSSKLMMYDLLMTAREQGKSLLKDFSWPHPSAGPFEDLMQSPQSPDKDGWTKGMQLHQIRGVFWGDQGVFRVWRLQLTSSHCPIVTVQGLVYEGFDTSANSSSFSKLHDSYPISQRWLPTASHAKDLVFPIIDSFLGPESLLSGSFRQ